MEACAPHTAAQKSLWAPQQLYLENKVQNLLTSARPSVLRTLSQLIICNLYKQHFAAVVMVYYTMHAHFPVSYSSIVVISTTCFTGIMTFFYSFPKGSQLWLCISITCEALNNYGTLKDVAQTSGYF